MNEQDTRSIQPLEDWKILNEIEEYPSLSFSIQQDFNLYSRTFRAMMQASPLVRSSLLHPIHAHLKSSYRKHCISSNSTLSAQLYYHFACQSQLFTEYDYTFYYSIIL